MLSFGRTHKSPWRDFLTNEEIIDEHFFRKAKVANKAADQCGVAAAACVLAAYPIIAPAAEIKVVLAGDQEVPPVKSAGSGSGTITIGTDQSVSDSVATKGISGTAAHIHEAPPGKNGPVIIPLTKEGDNTWKVKDGAKLSDVQLKSFEAGNLYVNVHTAANPGGELRGQLKP